MTGPVGRLPPHSAVVPLSVYGIHTNRRDYFVLGCEGPPIPHSSKAVWTASLSTGTAHNARGNTTGLNMELAVHQT